MKLKEALGILKKNGAIISEANKVDAGHDQLDESFIGFLKKNGYRLAEAKTMNLEDWMYHVENVIYDRDYDPGMIEDIRAWAKEWYGKLVMAGCTTKEIDTAFFATENYEYDAPLKLLRSKRLR